MSASLAILLLCAAVANSYPSLHNYLQRLNNEEDTFQMGIVSQNNEPSYNLARTGHIGWSRKRRSLAGLSSTLMSVSKIADNPPGAKEQREFEMQQQQERELRERQHRLRKLKELQRLRDYEEQQYEKRYGERPVLVRGNEEEQRRPMWLPKKQEQYRPMPEGAVYVTEEEEKFEPPLPATRVAPQQVADIYEVPYQAPSRRIAVPEDDDKIVADDRIGYAEADTYKPPSRCESYEREYKPVFEPLYEEYEQKPNAYARIKRSFIGGLGLDFTDNIHSISDGQIRKDIDQSRFKSLEDRSQDLTTYEKPLLQTDGRLPAIEEASKGVDYAMPVRKQPKLLQSLNVLCEPEYPEYITVARELPHERPDVVVGTKGRTEPWSGQFLQTPVSDCESNAQPYADPLPRASMFTDEEYIPADDLKKAPYAAANQQALKSDLQSTKQTEAFYPEYVQEIPDKVRPVKGSPEEQQKLHRLYDNFDAYLPQAPPMQQADFEKSFRSIPELAVPSEETLGEPQKSLTRKQQLGATAKELQQLDDSWTRDNY